MPVKLHRQTWRTTLFEWTVLTTLLISVLVAFALFGPSYEELLMMVPV